MRVPRPLVGLVVLAITVVWLSGFGSSRRAAGVLTVRQIQETSNPVGDSPRVGESVQFEGVVTAVSPHGQFYYVSDASGGEWSGIKVQGASLVRRVGELLRVSGDVQEYFDETRVDESSVVVLGEAPLPVPTLITVADLVSSPERFEGVLVRVANVTVEDETSRFGEFPFRDDTGTGGMVDDEFFHSYIGEFGDTFEAIQGVVAYGFGDFLVEPRSDDDLFGYRSGRDFDGEVSFSVFDDRGSPLPSRATFFRAEGGGLVLGPRDRAEGGEDVAYLTLGQGVVKVPSGTYHVVISRGIEYGIHEETVVVPSGGVAAVTATLSREVDTSTWISGDFHLHCAPSFDTPLPLPGRIMSLAGEGVEWAIATDHNVVTDYSPVITQLGLDDWMRSSIGDEITTRSPSFGHFNAWPLRPGEGPAPFSGLTPAALFAGARAAADGAVVVQVNHPVIDGSNQYFQVYDVNPITGVPQTSGFSFDFDALEVMNGRFLVQGLENFETWMGMINDGHRITATGNSDSHHLVFAEPGYPRNFVKSTALGPREAREADLVQAVLDGQVFVSYGPVLDFEINQQGLGALVTLAPDESVSIEARVQCASWLTATRATLYRNGRVLEEFALPLDSGPSDVSLESSDDPTQDSWYVLLVDGEGDLDPVRRGAEFRPLAFTNPIYVDVDGDGTFTPPGNFAELDAVADIDAVDFEGRPLRLGEWVVVEGCAISAADGVSGVVYLQDATGGVQLREAPGALTAIRRGDKMRVGGVVGEVLGETVLTDAEVEIRERDACPAPRDFRLGILGTPEAEAWEGMAVRIFRANVTSGTWPANGAEGAVTISDPTGSATLLIPQGVTVPEEASTLEDFEFTALVSQRDFSPPFTSGYRLVLRAGEDLFPHRIPPEEVLFDLDPSPNPFREALRVPLASGDDRFVEIVDVTGRRVRRLVADPEAEALTWDGLDRDGRRVASGIYFVRRVRDGRPVTDRVVKLR